jgi:predicted HD phosphohydrolase
MTEATVAEIVAACESMTGLPYDGEPVDQLEHALQCAALATAQIDDLGKVPGADVPGIDGYRAVLARVVEAARP